MDHSRVVDIMRRAGQLPLVKDYLISVQKNNLLAVSGRELGESSVASEVVQATGTSPDLRLPRVALKAVLPGMLQSLQPVWAGTILRGR